MRLIIVLGGNCSQSPERKPGTHRARGGSTGASASGSVNVLSAKDVKKLLFLEVPKNDSPAVASTAALR